MVSTNKCLAQSNKCRTGGEATKERNRHTMNATASAFGTLADERDDQRAEIRQLKVEVTKVGATIDQLSVLSREREVVDLPNPLIRRTTVN